MPPLKPAGAFARPAARKCAPSRKKSASANLKPHKKPGAPKPIPHTNSASHKPVRKKPAAPRRKTASATPAPLPLKQAPPPREADPFAKGTGARLACYAPEFLAEARRRIEQTLQSTTAIAHDFGLHHDSLARLVRRYGWVRPEGALARNLSPAMRLAARADALVTASAHSRLGSVSGVNSSGNPEPSAQKELGPRFRGDERAEKPSLDTSAIDRLEAAVLEELARVEATRAGAAAEPPRPADAGRTARTLSVLTETLAKLGRLPLAAQPQPGRSHDDIPADIDEFRNELARRIDALVASEPDEGGTDKDRAAVVAVPEP
jgi:hypothetical protein